MSPICLRRAFLLLWLTTGTVLLWLSLRTVLPELFAAGVPRNSHALVLSGFETFAVVLFLLPGTLRLGGVSLLAVLALALLLHALKGEFAAPLLLYGAAVLFITVHGYRRVRTPESA